ncbi:hypothetical protein BB561_004042 [Smittium simulii]|uniref:CCHC-type domain-containing protein n=1 Tax=Smittium simulii TaxID=133385 RepID=A0A2T9YID8_9FUNG|nr:hypothetical protein BB561_004042 [Smittium simulii]
MQKVPGVIPSSAAGVPYHSAKRTRLEYSTVAKTGLIDPVSKPDYHFNFPPKNIQKTQVSYTNAAKNQKKVTYDATVYKEVSIKHCLDNSEPHQLKIMCMGGSDRRIGCSWRQFPDNINEALDYVTDAQLNEANCFFKISVHYCGRQVDLYQTVNIDKDITVIKINNFQKVGVKTMANALKETLNLIGEISDISAWAVKNKGRFMPYDIKVLFKKNDEKVEIHNLFEVRGEFIPITYRGCQPICSFCKKSGHWNSECSIIFGSKKQILKQEPKTQGKPNEFAKNLAKYKQNRFQSNGAQKNNGWSEVIPEKPNTNFSEENKQNANSLDKAQKKVFESLTSYNNNKMLNIRIKKHEITQDETQIAIQLESPDNNNGLFTDSDLSSNLSYTSSPVAIDMIEPETNKDNSVGRINIGLMEQLCEQQKNTDIKMDEQ